MAVCGGCGRRRIPIPGLDRHPNCYPEDVSLWTPKEWAEWSARLEQDSPARPPERHAGARNEER